MTNFEKIKNMSMEEFALYFTKKSRSCDICAYDGHCRETEKTCKDGIKEFLESEAE